MPSYAPLAVLVIAACAHPARPAQDHVATPPRVVASPTVSSPTVSSPTVSSPTASSPTAPGPAASSERVLAMLVRRCGQCHQGSRPTALPAALAIFDLDDASWPQRFDAHRFEVALARLGDEPESDRTLFLAFHPKEADSQLESR